jgi:hypothetical protein
MNEENSANNAINNSRPENKGGSSPVITKEIDSESVSQKNVYGQKKTFSSSPLSGFSRRSFLAVFNRMVKVFVTCQENVSI